MGYNQYQPLWKANASLPAHTIFKTPEDLQKGCLEYFQWINDNPLYERKVGFCYGDVVETDVPKMRAMTITGLSLFLGVTKKTWYEWKKTRDDLKAVMDWAEQMIWNQKFEGAAAGMLNHNIIARELGLADKQIHETHVPKMVIRPPAGNAPDEPPIHEG